MARYSIYIQGKDKYYEIPLKFSNGEEKIKCDLEEIDAFFAKPFNDNESDNLQSFLKDVVDKGLINETPKNKPFIGYKYQGTLRRKELIVNNSYIYAMANRCIEAKRMNNKNVLTESSDLDSLINEIIMLAINNNEAFRSMFFSNLFPKHVYDLLNDYRNLLKKEDYMDKVNDINELKRQISYNIRKYPNLRTIYLWKNRFDKKTDKQDENEYEYEYDLLDLANKEKQETNVDVEEQSVEEVKEEKISAAELISHKKDYYNNLFDWANENKETLKEEPVQEEKISAEDYINNYNSDEVYEFLEQYAKPNYCEITNPRVDYYFKEGGINSVLANCSLDDIEALSPEEKRYIGYESIKRGR